MLVTNGKYIYYIYVYCMIFNFHNIHCLDCMWEVNNYYLTLIEPMTLKTLMNIQVVNITQYPFAFRFIQGQPATTETSLLYILWLHPCGIATVTLGLQSSPARDKGPSRSASKSSTIIWIKSWCGIHGGNHTKFFRNRGDWRTNFSQNWEVKMKG